MSSETLFSLAGIRPEKPRLSDVTLLMVDCQNEYLRGPLALVNVDTAVAMAARLLASVRHRGGRVIHIAHRGAPGGLFDRAAVRGAIIAALSPLPGEVVIEKTRPNSFSDTGLQGAVGPAGTALLLAGFMTHMCISTTARAALDLGYPVTIASDACATRDLPGHEGGIVDAQTLHRAELAALADRFAGVYDTETLLA